MAMTAMNIIMALAAPNPSRLRVKAKVPIRSQQTENPSRTRHSPILPPREFDERNG